MTNRTLDDVTPAEWDGLRKSSIPTGLADAQLLAHVLRRHPEGSKDYMIALETLAILLETRDLKATEFITGHVNRMLKGLRDVGN